jgi:DtxR family Mn-dependent transcriptional regulator
MVEEFTESYEDYLKAIFQISKKKKGGWCSNSEISEYLKVKPASVTGMLYKLRDNGLIKWEPRKSLRLTKKGKDVALNTLNKYNTLKDFFEHVLNLRDRTLTEKLCCGMEHHITTKVSESLRDLIEID